MVSRVNSKTSHALTLIELLIAISISTLLGGATVFMLRSSLDAYTYAEEQALIHKILDETLEEITGEGLRNYGIKDALEILEVKPDAITFICLWTDDSKQASSTRKTFTLDRPFKPGSPTPIVEFKAHNKVDFTPSAITFIPRDDTAKGRTQDTVILDQPVPSGSQLKIMFQPETKNYPDAAMKLKWDAQTGAFERTYMNKKELIPKVQFKGFKLAQAKFQYFDNTNSEVLTPAPAELLSTISAVKLTLSLEPENKGKLYQASAFINLRNSRASGKGIIIREGMRMKIPDSSHIRTLSLGNITGVKPGDIIQILAKPKQGNAWRVTLELGIKDRLPIIEKYSIDYPPGLTVYSEKVNLTLDLAFSFLDIGGNGRYDYDFDKDVGNVVNLEGEVFLSVEKMAVQGAALSVRP